MNAKRFLLAHGLLAFLILFFDRATKLWALDYCVMEHPITNFLSCALTFNRGVSWGILNDASSIISFFMTMLIAVIILIISHLTFSRLREGLWSLEYVAIVVGAASNLFDRLLYGAVIDFILFYFNGWHFPVFNIADVCIVVGVMIIMARTYAR